MKNPSMFIKLIEKMESYSLKKQFWILFFMATWDLWVMPLVTIFLYATGLGDSTLFQTPSYKRFGHSTPNSSELVTYYVYYAGFLQILPESLNPFVLVTLFPFISFVLFLILLIRMDLAKPKKSFYMLVGTVVYYGGQYFMAILGIFISYLIYDWRY